MEHEARLNYICLGNLISGDCKIILKLQYAQVRVSMKRASKGNKDEKSFLDTSKADLSNDILDIQDKPDVAVWNKKVRIQRHDKGKVKIGSLNQNLINEETNDPIDPADKESVAGAVISGAQLTDRVDLSKSNYKNKKQR